MRKYDNIQLLRVLSCLGIFITHLAPRMGAAGYAASAANFCASGVYLFFLISGFLACCAKEIRPGCGWKGILAYYCKRLFRILPLYYAVIVYQMVLHGLILRDVPADPAGLSWLRYFFLTNAFIPGPDNFWSNLGATWTISLFCVFYLCAPLLVHLIEGKRGGVFRAAALYLAALLLRCLWVAAGLSSYMMVFYYLHYFVLGMLVWELAAAYPPAKAAGGFGLAAAALGGLLQAVGAGNDYFTVISWIYAVIVLATGNFSWKKEDAASGRIARAVGVLDVYSYAIYLVHASVIDGIYLLQAHVRLPGITVLLTAVALTAIGAYLAHLLIEKPAEKLGRRLVARLKI